MLFENGKLRAIVADVKVYWKACVVLNGICTIWDGFRMDCYGNATEQQSLLIILSNIKHF